MRGANGSRPALASNACPFLGVFRGMFLPKTCGALMRGRSSQLLRRHGLESMLHFFFETCFSQSLLARWTTTTSPSSRRGRDVVRQLSKTFFLRVGSFLLRCTVSLHGHRRPLRRQGLDKPAPTGAYSLLE